MRPKILETPQEWYHCMNAGMAAVRRPYTRERARQLGPPKLSLYHITSFQDCHGWSVYHGRGTCKLQTVIWRQVADGQKMKDWMTGHSVPVTAQPTVEESTVDIDAQWFQRQLAALAVIRIPLATDHPMGCDGESFGIHRPHEFEVEWWCEGPPEWADLARWVYGCIDVFRRTTSA